MTNPEIPEDAVERTASLLHGFEHDRLNSRCPGSDDCQLWYDAEFRAAALLPALPHLRVQETPAMKPGEICYNDGPPHPRTECHEDRCGLDPSPHPRPVVDREALREITTEKALRAYYMADEWDQEAWLGHHAEFADLILALLPTEEGEGS